MNFVSVQSQAISMTQFISKHQLLYILFFYSVDWTGKLTMILFLMFNITYLASKVHWHLMLECLPTWRRLFQKYRKRSHAIRENDLVKVIYYPKIILLLLTLAGLDCLRFIWNRVSYIWEATCRFYAVLYIKDDFFLCCIVNLGRCQRRGGNWWNSMGSCLWGWALLQVLH